MWKTLSTPSVNFTCCYQLLFPRVPMFLVTHTLAQKNFERLFSRRFQAQSLQLCLFCYLSLPGFGLEFESDPPSVK